jgi:hypothetical protein
MSILKSDTSNSVTTALGNGTGEHPFAVDQRGLYFTSEAEMSLTDSVLNTRFTLEFIVKPEANGSLLMILTPSDSHVLTFSLTADALSL